MVSVLGLLALLLWGLWEEGTSWREHRGEEVVHLTVNRKKSREGKTTKYGGTHL